MGSQFGHIFRLHTFGESHGRAIGGIIEGCPPGIELDLEGIQQTLNRRRPGQSNLTSPRKESDRVEWLSGIIDNQTLGTPIGFQIRNKDADSSAYREFKDRYRPSHADFTTEAKYGIRDWRGGGRASARETAARVVGGAIALQVLQTVAPVEILAWVNSVGNIQAKVDKKTVTATSILKSKIQCPDPEASQLMIARINAVKKERDTVGGVISAICRGIPPGWGDPVFDKLEANLAKAMLSIPAAKGFEIGSGFSGTLMKGSEHNDTFIPGNPHPTTTTNHSGGIQGGISNGMPIYFNVAFKPVSTIFQPQQTVNKDNQVQSINPRGRHDPCVLPRATVIVESMAAICLCDHMLRQRAIKGII